MSFPDDSNQSAILPKPEGCVEPKQSLPEPKASFNCTFPNCPKSYTRIRSLEVHIRTKRQVEKQYHCTWQSCGKVCSRASYVEEHIRMCHLKIPKSVAKQERIGPHNSRPQHQLKNPHRQLSWFNSPVPLVKRKKISLEKKADAKDNTTNG